MDYMLSAEQAYKAS